MDSGTPLLPEKQPVRRSGPPPLASVDFNIPAATDCLTRDVVTSLKEAGLDQMALSLDFPRAELHDAFRGVPGAFAKTIEAAAWAREAGIPLQINTTVCGDTAPYLEEMAAFVATLGIVFWEVFFLVPTGRGSVLAGLTAFQCERLFDVIYRTQRPTTAVTWLSGNAWPSTTDPSRCPRSSPARKGRAIRWASPLEASTRGTASSSYLIAARSTRAGSSP
jgi:hypothetical protein